MVQGDVLRAIDSLRMTQKHIVGELHAIVKALLGRGTREAMLGWLGGVLEGNGERAKMRSNLAVAASHGFFLNLDAVMLKLCGPFLDPSSDVFWKRVDVRYVTQAKRISFAEVRVQAVWWHQGHSEGAGQGAQALLQATSRWFTQLHRTGTVCVVVSLTGGRLYTHVDQQLGHGS